MKLGQFIITFYSGKMAAYGAEKRKNVFFFTSTVGISYVSKVAILLRDLMFTEIKLIIKD